MSRSVSEWEGKSHDSKIPDRVKLRIWLRDGGRCHLTGRRIMPGDKFEYEHVIELCNGGRHAESNIKLALKGKEHKAKTAAALKQRARSDAAVKRHAGIRKPSRMAGSKDSPIKMTFNGPVWRATGEPVRPK